MRRGELYGDNERVWYLLGDERSITIGKDPTCPHYGCMKLVPVASLAAVALLVRLAWCEPELQPPVSPRFGDAARIATTADFDLSFGHLSHSGDFDVPRTSVTVR